MPEADAGRGAQSDFTDALRLKYREAVALAAGASVDKVTIESVTPVTTARRMLLAEGIEVATGVEFPAGTEAAALPDAAALTTAVNAALVDDGVTVTVTGFTEVSKVAMPAKQDDSSAAPRAFPAASLFLLAAPALLAAVF